MNHYPHHVGDYLKKTIGLSMAQDGAYRRALDWYYSHEGPLPPKPEVYAELRCMSKQDRDAVDVVLGKYFTETPDGFRHERCDEEIAAYADSAAEEEERREHERLRQERSRARRKELFAALREHGIIPKWDTPIGELEAHLSRVTGRDRHRDRHAPVTDNDTANQNQNQNQNQVQEQKPRRARAASPDALPDWLPPDAWQRWRQHRGRKLTAAAVTLQVRKLEALRDLGHPPDVVIDLAIESGWATFYAPKGSTRPSLSEAGNRTADALGSWFSDEERPNGTTGP